MQEVECEQCGTIEQKWQSEIERTENHFCSQKCYKIWSSKTEKGGKAMYDCDWCGEKTRKRIYRARKKDHIFCNNDCQSNWQKENMNLENHPSWNEEKKVVFRCDYCNAKRKRSKRLLGENTNFCSTSCMSKYRKRDGVWEDEDHPAYEGGEYNTKIRKFRASQKWRDLQETILERDNNKCQDCGRAENLQVHHIIPMSEDFSKRADRDNLVSLCVRCHSDKHPELPSHLFRTTKGRKVVQ